MGRISAKYTKGSKFATPLEKATEINERLEYMQKIEINRIAKHYMHKEAGEDLRDNVYKVFKYMFGSKIAEEQTAKFMREKKVTKGKCEL